MKTLVTGAAGFIGSHLCEYLVSNGHEVTGLDCYSNYYSVALKKRNADDLGKRGIPVQDLDLSEDDCGPLLDQTEVVFHLAAQPGIAAHVTFEEYVKNNITATYRLLNACLDAGKVALFVNISTSSVYGYYATSPETEAPRPASYYGVTKLAAEQLVLSRSREGKMPACSLRLFSVYGPRERPEKLYTKLISAILNNEVFPLFEGSEMHRRSYTYVGDIVRGIAAVLANRDKCNGEIFNIGSDTEITTGRGIEIVEEILGKKAQKEMLPPRQGDQIRTHANIEKAKQMLGYHPIIQPEEGLKKQVEWYQRAFR